MLKILTPYLFSSNVILSNSMIYYVSEEYQVFG